MLDFDFTNPEFEDILREKIDFSTTYWTTKLLVTDITKIVKAKKAHLKLGLKTEEDAIDVCLHFCSLLLNVGYDHSERADRKNRKVNLHSVILGEAYKSFRLNGEITKRYIVIKKFLVTNKIINTYDYYSTATGESKPIELVDYYYYLERQAKFIKRLATSQLIKSHIINSKQQFYNAYKTNSIISVLFKTYPHLEIPSLKEVKAEADRIIKNKEQLTRGRKLVKLHRYSKTHPKFKKLIKQKRICFYEDSLEIFTRNTTDGFYLPKISEKNAGGRVVDSFNLMPSWIRKLIKINGERLVTLDFKCLHPNIVLSLYNSHLKYITHQQVCNELNEILQLKKPLSIHSIKTQHLSVFNQTAKKIKLYKVYHYYNLKDPDFMDVLLKEKENNPKLTTKKMFTKEVELMTTIMDQFDALNIKALYIYDAVMVEPKNVTKALEIMNAAAIKLNIHTIATKD